MRFLFICLVFILSCSGNDVPKDVLPPHKMQSILHDVVRADEWADFAVLQDSTFRKFSKRTALYDSIFRLHSITKTDYRKSMDYYQSRPDLLKEIFDSLRIKSDTALKKLEPDTSRKLKKILDTK